jgi:hypothetical protein
MAAEGPPRMLHPWFPGAALFGLVLGVLHIAAPWVRETLRGRETAVRSFGGGMALTYVFVLLLPELDRAHALLGRKIFVVALASLLVYYAIGEHLHRSRARAAGRTRGQYRVSMLQLWVYNWLIFYSTPLEFQEFGLRALAVAMALVLHLVHADYDIGMNFPQEFDRSGRYILSVAPLVGWASAVATTKESESVGDIFVAILAGTLLYNVFKEELPAEGQSRFGWFFAGVVLFFASVLLAVR